MDVIRWHRYHILHLVEIVGQSKDIGREGVVDSVCNGGNAQIRPSDMFEWMPCADTDIIYYISSELLANQKLWDMKVSLIVLAMVEMWRPKIPPPSQDMEELHKVDLQGKNDEDWKEVHKDYIGAWNSRMEFLPICEPFFSSDTTTCLEYMSWFRVTSKSYLLLVEARNATTCTFNDDDIDVVTDPTIDASFNAQVNTDVYSFWDTIHLHVSGVSDTHLIIVLSRWIIGATIFYWSGGYMMGG
ncbi:hypothetical protein GOBAR_AA35881 [Gossypium barbadense]|uniref:Aminotransferase-like plant mobile domain-containing protein n=1 Tax=Gossypium barbadense TaxID=3634 RepID=A0A2P5W156_GOSBA|nr:hypothetical protein GOBAR_AA35881 [Gossypium barbadense]